jgi:hypothetical protein
MSLLVKLEDDLGERSEWVMLHGLVPTAERGDFLLLSGVDPFGKTVFNHLQMEAFLAEWDRIRDRSVRSLAKGKANGGDLPPRPRFVSAVCGQLMLPQQ